MCPALIECYACYVLHRGPVPPRMIKKQSGLPKRNTNVRELDFAHLVEMVEAGSSVCLLAFEGTSTGITGCFGGRYLRDCLKVMRVRA